MNKVNVVVKNILIVFMLLIMSVCFIACGQNEVIVQNKAEVSSAIINNLDGSVEEIVRINLNEQHLLDSGHNNNEIKQIKNSIKIDAKNIAGLIRDSLNDKVYAKLSSPFVDANTKKVMEEYYDGIIVKEDDWKNNSYAIIIKFKTLNIYKYFYNITEVETVKMKQDEHFFYNKLFWYGNPMFLNNRNMYVNIKGNFESQYANIINFEDSEFLYTHCADLRRLHSSADIIENIEGQYLHTWVLDMDKSSEQVEFYYNVANTYNWIIVSLLATLCITVILSIIVLIVKNNKKLNKN